MRPFLMPPLGYLCFHSENESNETAGRRRIKLDVTFSVIASQITDNSSVFFNIYCSGLTRKKSSTLCTTAYSWNKMTSSNWNIFRVTDPLKGDPLVTGGFPSQRLVKRSFDVFFDVRLNIRLSKQHKCWWFETPWLSLWRHSNEKPQWISRLRDGPVVQEAFPCHDYSCPHRYPFKRHMLCHPHACTWWRHQMEAFSALLAICAGNSPVSGEFPAQRPVTRSFDVFFDLRLNKRLNKQSWGWWFETLSCSLWRHRNGCPSTSLC